MQSLYVFNVSKKLQSLDTVLIKWHQPQWLLQWLAAVKTWRYRKRKGHACILQALQCTGSAEIKSRVCNSDKLNQNCLWMLKSTSEEASCTHVRSLTLANYLLKKIKVTKNTALLGFHMPCTCRSGVFDLCPLGTGQADAMQVIPKLTRISSESNGA